MKIQNGLKIILLLILPVLTFAQSAKPVSGKYLPGIFEKGDSILKYRIMYPYDFDQNKEYPLVIFLHGMRERGADNDQQLLRGSRFFQDSLRSFPAIVLFPQCPKKDSWANVAIPVRKKSKRYFIFNYDEEPTYPLAMVMELINTFITYPYIDENRVYVSGLSMGGMGTFEICWRMQDKLAAGIPLGGGGPAEKATEMTNVPLWIFHGVNDPSIRPSYSIDMLKGIQRSGGKAKITLYPDTKHACWDKAFSDPEFLSWMFSQSRKPGQKNNAISGRQF